MREAVATAIPGARSERTAIFCAAITGLLAFLVAMAGGELSLKMWVGAIAGLAFLALTFASGHAKPILIGCWVFSLTYNRQYFIFGPVVGNHGGQGPYLVVSDIFLGLLLAMWASDLILNKRISRPRGKSLWPWLLPFAIASVISVVQSARPEWGMFEMLRQVRIAMVLLYWRHQAGKTEWWAAIGALVLAVAFQSSVGIGEMATGRSGVLGIFGLGQQEVIPEELQQERFYGWHRATATMSHPPNLACYLLFIIPILFALAFGTRKRLISRPALVGGIIGLGGLACTLSRWPVALMVLELVLLLAGLVGLRLCSVKVAVGSAVTGLLLGGTILLSFQDFIMDRMMRDLNASIEFRKKDDATGIRMAMDHPLFGVGLNNYFYYLIEYEPEWQWALKYEDLAVQNHTRPLAAPHSAYLAILAETGFVGLLTFCLALAGVVWTAVRAVAGTRGPWQVVSFALLVGLIGLFLQQAVDFSLLVDPLLYTLALVLGLLNIAPDLFRSTQRQAAFSQPVPEPA